MLWHYLPHDETTTPYVGDALHLYYPTKKSGSTGGAALYHQVDSFKEYTMDAGWFEVSGYEFGTGFDFSNIYIANAFPTFRYARITMDPAKGSIENQSVGGYVFPKVGPTGSVTGQWDTTGGYAGYGNVLPNGAVARIMPGPGQGAAHWTPYPQKDDWVGAFSSLNPPSCQFSGASPVGFWEIVAYDETIAKQLLNKIRFNIKDKSVGCWGYMKTANPSQARFAHREPSLTYQYRFVSDGVSTGNATVADGQGHIPSGTNFNEVLARNNNLKADISNSVANGTLTVYGGAGGQIEQGFPDPDGIFGVFPYRTTADYNISNTWNWRAQETTANTYVDINGNWGILENNFTVEFEIAKSYRNDSNTVVFANDINTSAFTVDYGSTNLLDHQKLRIQYNGNAMVTSLETLPFNIDGVTGPAPGDHPTLDSLYNKGWYHVSINKVSNTVTCYIDGANAGSMAVTTPSPGYFANSKVRMGQVFTGTKQKLWYRLRGLQFFNAAKYTTTYTKPIFPYWS